MWLVYILLNKHRNKTYTGSTDNFKRRLKQHNDNLVEATKNLGPWTPLYIEFYPDEKFARAREKELKSTTGRRYLKNVINSIIKVWDGSSVG